MQTIQNPNLWGCILSAVFINGAGEKVLPESAGMRLV
jgi:hypothetical protein